LILSDLVAGSGGPIQQALPFITPFRVD
jgi:hypothetical protein